MFKFHGKCLSLKAEVQKFSKLPKNKLSACSEKLIGNLTSTLDMRHSYMSVVFTYNCRRVFKKIVWYGRCSLLIFVAKKLLKELNFNF